MVTGRELVNIRVCRCKVSPKKFGLIVVVGDEGSVLIDESGQMLGSVEPRAGVLVYHFGIVR